MNERSSTLPETCTCTHTNSSRPRRERTSRHLHRAHVHRARRAEAVPAGSIARPRLAAATAAASGRPGRLGRGILRLVDVREGDHVVRDLRCFMRAARGESRRRLDVLGCKGRVRSRCRNGVDRRTRAHGGSSHSHYPPSDLSLPDPSISATKKTRLFDLCADLSLSISATEKTRLFDLCAD
jgi:hypothetical protein